MDLTYPPHVQQLLDRLDATLSDVSLEQEIDAASRAPELWANGRPASLAAEPWSPLARVAAFRRLGAHAIAPGELLRRTHLPFASLPPEYVYGGVAALAWPDPGAPWQPGDAMAVDFDAGRLTGEVVVAPHALPADRLVLMARSDVEVVLVLAGPDRGHVERVGDTFKVRFEDAPAEPIAGGAEALTQWERLALAERLALLGLTLGLIDRTWRIALDALSEGKRNGNLLADEQVAQFQLADNYIERMAAEHLVLDIAIDAEQGLDVTAKLAMARYHTSNQAERCAGRALHVAALFQPRVVPVARWFVERAHLSSVYGMAREHEVRFAAAGLIDGMSLE